MTGGDGYTPVDLRRTCETCHVVLSHLESRWCLVHRPRDPDPDDRGFDLAARADGTPDLLAPTYTGMLPFGGPVIEDVGDELDRRYTPASLALAVVREVAQLFEVDPDVVIEPSVGDGAFVDAFRVVWPRVRVLGCDLDPRARGLARCDVAVVADWETFAAQLPFEWRQARLVAGNPPFSVALRHVRAIREELPEAVASLIMPWAYFGVDEWQPLLAADPLRRAHAVAGRPWPKNVRETAAYTWDRRSRRPAHTELITPAIEW